VIEVDDLTMKLAALVGPNFTSVAAEKSEPVIVTDVPPPAGPRLGLTLMTSGP
jgi:hypothetical protein